MTIYNMFEFVISIRTHNVHVCRYHIKKKTHHQSLLYLFVYYCITIGVYPYLPGESKFAYSFFLEDVYNFFENINILICFVRLYNLQYGEINATKISMSVRINKWFLYSVSRYSNQLIFLKGSLENSFEMVN